MSYTPIQVRFRLVRPMHLPSYPIHLDALLAWARVQEAEEQGMDDPYATQEDLPLERSGRGEDAVWCASQILARPLAPPMQLVMTKRFELDALAHAKDRAFSGGPNKLPMGTGPFKAFVLNAPVAWVGEVVAYALGDPERVGELLERVPSIGKLRRNTLGKIAERRILPDSRAREAWKLRVMPDPIPGYQPIQATIAPPYWDKTRRRTAYCPVEIPGEMYANP